jgi:hypothetical protein
VLANQTVGGHPLAACDDIDMLNVPFEASAGDLGTLITPYVANIPE